MEGRPVTLRKFFQKKLQERLKKDFSNANYLNGRETGKVFIIENSKEEIVQDHISDFTDTAFSVSGGCGLENGNARSSAKRDPADP